MDSASTCECPILDRLNVKEGASRKLMVDRTEFLNFGGCNYLALSNRPELRNSARAALDKGCLFSRWLNSEYGGIDPPFERVEREAACFWGQEAALYLPSGYLLGFAAMAALAPLFDVIALDEQAHWCLVDAARLTKKHVIAFSHCDPDALAKVLGSIPRGQRPLVATDGVFATTGRLPPLDRYAQLIRDHEGQLFVDESHAAGVAGKMGRGALEHFDLSERVHSAATLSKAFCGQGALFTGTAEMVTRAKKSPAIRGSNQGSPISAEVSAAALKLVRENPHFCETTRNTTTRLRAELRSLGLWIIDSPAPIVSFSYGTREDLRGLQQVLFEQRMYVLHSNYIGAGPAGTIRLAVFRDHTSADIDRLVDAIRRYLR